MYLIKNLRYMLYLLYINKLKVMLYNLYYMIFVRKRTYKEFWKDLKLIIVEIFIFRYYKKFYRSFFSLIYFLLWIFIIFIGRINNKIVFILK